MKQKHLFIVAAVLLLSLAAPPTAQAYDFSATAPSGQTLYFNLIDSGVEVTSEHVYGGYSTKPVGDLVIPDTVTYGGATYAVTSIDDHAFFGCIGLTSVTIGDGVTSIGDYAFGGCFGLTSITIPDGVTSIGDYAFGGCIGLTSITIPDGVTSIGDRAFYDCESLTSLTIPDGVTAIGDEAFYNCTGLTSLTIPAGVTSISRYAFYGCTGLTSVTIPAGVTSIDNYAFELCTGLTRVTIPDGVISIGNSAFHGCTGLTSLTIPDGVTSIGDCAFCDCTGLTSIVVDEGNTHYDSRNGCNAIIHTDLNLLIQGCNTTVIPEDITFIGNAAFMGCSGLTSITIPDGVTSIGDNAFDGCTGLTSITIPDGVTSIGSDAFWGCDNLDTIYSLPIVPPSLGGDVFPHYVKVFIPCHTQSYYQTAWNGYRFTFLEPDAGVDMTLISDNPDEGSVDIIPQEGHRILCSDSSTVISATANYGYHFTHWSNGSTKSLDTLYLQGDCTVTAYFAKNIYAVNVVSNDTTMGTVSSDNDSVAYLDSVTLTATARYGYHFTHWRKDGILSVLILSLCK